MQALGRIRSKCGIKAIDNIAFHRNRSDYSLDLLIMASKLNRIEILRMRQFHLSRKIGNFLLNRKNK